MIRRLTTVLCTAVLASFSISVTAAETNVVEAFGCNFNDGKTMTDLDAVVKYYTAERSKIASPALQKMVSRVWTPTLGNVPVDLVDRHRFCLDDDDVVELAQMALEVEDHYSNRAGVDRPMD